MNSWQIFHLLKRHPQTRGVFVGVYAVDDLPRKPRYRKPCAYIANTDPKSEPGTHWVAFYFGKIGVDYFDSSGRYPLPEFQHFMGTWNYKRNAHQIQSLMTSTCGQHCIFYIWKRSQGLEMEDIVSKFDKHNLLKNDVFVTESVESQFGTNLEVIDVRFLSGQISRKLT